MTTPEIAATLVEHCRAGRYDEAYGLFAENAISVEPEGLPDNVVSGLPNILKKSAAWSAMTKEVHEIRVSDPIVCPGYFAVTMYIDITKNDGTREKATEICLYKVVNGKITEERFFYEFPPMG